MNTARVSRPLHPTKLFPFSILLVSAVLLFLGLAVAASVMQPPQIAETPDGRFARCDHYAGMAIEKLAAKGIDLRPDVWRRQREIAVQACMNDFADLEWLQYGM